ncbi:MAG: hypothetical protein KDN05_10105 [Verrucomicrobiae bacterium]|nr:hypothetical protein [Verrucomicrobiae bacterium]
MDDAWQLAYGASKLAPDDDDDGDGATNEAESVMGTDPLDGEDCLRLEAPVRFSNAVLLHWQGLPGKRYEVEWMVEDQWEVCDDGLVGVGSEITAALPPHPIGSRLVRVRLITEGTEATARFMTEDSTDTDRDGQNDYMEFLAGTDPMDAGSRFQIESISLGDVVSLRWDSTMGKRYQIETSTSPANGDWLPLADEVPGTGGPIELDAPVPMGRARFFRLRVRDSDTDKDGLSDWSELVAGSDMNRPELIPPELPTGGSVVRVELAAATAVVNRNETAAFRLVREGLLGPLAVRLQTGGTGIPGQDYEPLPCEVRFGAGQRAIEIPVRAGLPSMPLGGKSVTLNILPGNGYQSGPACPWAVHLVSEHRLSVRDFGAAGDGITDDAAAVQAAITALEASSTANTLWFPAGRYRLATLTPQNQTPGSYYCSVHLSEGTESSKDLIFSGEQGAVLYAEPGNLRSQMMLVPARFRSYSFRGLTWEKSPEPRLLPSAGMEPNWSDGVSLVNHQGIGIAEASFLDCTFINCHGAVRTYAAGTDTWGKLGVFRMGGCEVLNPYGSNAMSSPQPYGGGQQVNLVPWVRYALYEGNLFNGSTDGVIDDNLNPGRVPKDGCHFGSPLELKFVNNTVRNMGVEAVFKTHDTSFATTASAFTVPPPGPTTVEVTLQPWWSSTAQAGGHYLFRAYPAGGGSPVNIILTAVSHQLETNTLVVRNDGSSPQSTTGMTVPVGTSISWQEGPIGFSVIHGNSFHAAPSGGYAFATHTLADVTDNFAKNFWGGFGILRSPKHPGLNTAGGSRFSGNFVSLPKAEGSHFRCGFQVFGADIGITGNHIVSPMPIQMIGIRLEGSGIFVKDNSLAATRIIRNGYSTLSRSVGIGIGPGATNSVIRANHTTNFDLGVGQSIHNQAVVPFTVGGHLSDNDAIPIDPKGAIHEPEP